MNVLSFSIDGKLFGVDFKDVDEIVVMDYCIDIPSNLPFVSKVMPLRGQIIPLVDIAKIVGVNYVEGDKVIVLRGSFGLIVDDVVFEDEFSDASLEQNYLVYAAGKEVIKGRLRREEDGKLEFIELIDVDKLMEMLKV